MAIRCCGLDKSLPLPGLSSFPFFFFCIFPETPIPLSFLKKFWSNSKDYGKSEVSAF